MLYKLNANSLELLRYKNGTDWTSWPFDALAVEQILRVETESDTWIFERAETGQPLMNLVQLRHRENDVCRLSRYIALPVKPALEGEKAIIRIGVKFRTAPVRRFTLFGASFLQEFLEAQEKIAKFRRSCGGCTACCKVIEILDPELVKPAGVWCKHCAVGKGCKIYEKRPGSCRDFRCQWLINPEMTEAERPDKTKIVLDYVHLENGLPGGWIQMFEVSEGALESDYARRLTHGLVGDDLWVTHIPLKGQKKLFYLAGKALTSDIRESVREENFQVFELTKIPQKKILFA